MGKYGQHDTQAAGDMAENMRVIREAVGEQVELCIVWPFPLQSMEGDLLGAV